MSLVAMACAGTVTAIVPKNITAAMGVITYCFGLVGVYHLLTLPTD